MASIEKILDNKYIIIEKKDHDVFSNTYLVKEIDSGKKYFAKVYKEHSEYYEKEVEILKALSGPSHQCCLNLINNGIGPIVANNVPSENKQYLIMENEEKGNLFDYVSLPKRGFDEKHAKVIFSKILKRVKTCHDAGICNRDIKLENIILDGNFNPKIKSFCFAAFIRGQNGDNLLSSINCTISHAAPEILEGKQYNGIKADIFSLGVVLVNLVTCKLGFGKAIKNDPFYNYIITGQYDNYWAAVNNIFAGTSEELKNLFIKMVSYDPQERPNNINEILEDPWMKEIKDLSQNELNTLESEIIQEFTDREKIVAKEKEASLNNVTGE